MPIPITDSVTVSQTEGKIVVSGPKGSLELVIPKGIAVRQQDLSLVVSRASELSKVKALHGLTRALINNMVLGVTEGWSKKLELIGVGYRAALIDNKLTLNVGYSHPIEVVSPSGIEFQVADNTKITVSGIDKELVGKIAAKIKSVKKPEPYKGKGIRYAGEYIRRKAGKAGKVGAAGGK